MAKHYWQIGQFKMTVAAPDGVDVTGVSVDVEPPDRQGFLAAAEAAGGLGALQLPEHEQPYAQSAVAYLMEDVEDAEEPQACYSVSVAIKEPPRARPSGMRAPHPFFGPVRDRAERDRKQAEEFAERAAGGAGQ